jgi:hypothetical protein
MREWLALLPLSVAACTTMAADEPPPVVHGETPGYQCRSEGLEAFVGRDATAEAGGEILAKSGAKTLRWLMPNQVITMEYHMDRVNVLIGANNKIERVNCG